MTDPSSCDLSDACDQLGVDAVRSGVFRPAWPDCRPVGGLVTTVRLEPSCGAPSPLPELLDVLEEAAGGVVLVDLAGRLDLQCWGTALATAAERYGVRGALVNGAIRDVAGLRELAVPTYALGVHPGAMRGRLRLAAVGEPVELADGSIVAGSFAAADASGAVFLPAARIDEVRTLSVELRATETRQLAAIRGGADPRAVLAAEPASSRQHPPAKPHR